MRSPRFQTPVSFLVTALLFAAVPLSGNAEDAEKQTGGKRTIAERIALLEQELARMRKDMDSAVGLESPEGFSDRMDTLEAMVLRLRADLAAFEREKEGRVDDREELNARIDDLAEEASSIWREVDALKAESKRAKETPLAGYDNGFYIRSADGGFGFGIRGFLKPRYRIVLQSSPNGSDADEARLSSVKRNGFSLDSSRLAIEAWMPRGISARMEIDYGALSEELQHSADTDGPTADRVGSGRMEEHSLRFLDAYAEYAPMEAFFIRAGQFRAPFDEETRFSDNAMSFTSRSLMTRRYLDFGDSPLQGAGAENADFGYEEIRGSSFDRDVGVAVGGSVEDGLFSYELGAFNGAGSSLRNDNRDVLLAVRVFSDPLGRMTDGMSDTGFAGNPRLRLGAGFAFDLLEHEDRLVAGQTYNSADLSSTADVHLKWRGLAFMASVFFRHSDHGGAAASKGDPIRSLGVGASVSYFHSATGIEPAVRYSLYDARFDEVDDHMHEVTAALGYHLLVDHLVLRLEYRGLHPTDRDRSYMVPLGARFERVHEMTVMAEVSF